MARLLVVGWDAADWKVIKPLLAKGEMPHLARLMAEGVWGNLSTIYPPLSPMVWTSIATGKRPYKHGIYGFSEPAEDGLAVRPISILGRKTKAFWNILHQNGLRSIVVGWWPSHPAEPIRGAMVSNLFPLASGSTKMAPGTVWPPSWAERLAELRVEPGEISRQMIRCFVPDFQEVDTATDKSLHDLAAIIAETMSIHAAGTDLIANEPWDLAAVYFTGIDHFSHRFMHYHAHKAPKGLDTDPKVYAGIVANAYRYHDAMLGRLLSLAGDDCPVLVLSDHGFHSDRLLPDYIPAEGAGPAVEHRDFGIFCLRASGVKHGEQIHGASVLDIAPTILHLFGLPAARDMDGKVLANSFATPSIPGPIASWDDVPGDDGRHPPSRQYDSAASTEALKQLVDLGYIEPPGDDTARAVRVCMAELRYHQAQAYFGGGLPELAIPVLRELLDEDEEQARYYRQLIDCHLHRGDLAEAKNVLDTFDAVCRRVAPAAQAELARLRKEKPEDNPLPEPKSAEMFLWRQLQEKSQGYTLERLMLRLRLSLAAPEGDAARDEARRWLDKAAETAGRRVAPALFLAQAFTAVGEYDRALEYIRRVRRSDRDNWEAMKLEAFIHFAARRFEKAVESAVDSLALVYFQPPLHYLLGRALRQLGDDAQAEQSLRVALAQAPGLSQAHEELADLLRKDAPKIGEASLHLAAAQVGRKKAREKRRVRASAPVPASTPKTAPASFERYDGPPADRSRVVTVVAGLPRSGTSMMMQMLAAAGIAPYTDGTRVADADNPRGYFEHENATRLHRDAAWVPEVRGKAVKIVANLLPYLPDGEEYRVVFMLRKPEEVVASQRAMLARLGRNGAKLNDSALIRTYSGQLVRTQVWLNSRADVQLVGVDYGQTLANPEAAAARLAAFLGQPFDIAAAARSVDSTLQRQRA